MFCIPLTLLGPAPFYQHLSVLFHEGGTHDYLLDYIPFSVGPPVKLLGGYLMLFGRLVPICTFFSGIQPSASVKLISEVTDHYVKVIIICYDQ